MDVQEMQALSDEALRLLYEKYSEDLWAAGWMNTTHEIARDFVRWLNQDGHEWEDYERDGVDWIHQAIAETSQPRKDG